MRTAMIAVGLAMLVLVERSAGQAPKAPQQPRVAPPGTKAPAKAPTTITPPAAKTPAARTDAQASRGHEQDEQAIRKTTADLVKAYNAHDGQAIANLFAPDGELASEDGDVQQGREAIGEEFATVFAEYPDASIKVEIESIRFLAPNLAVEDGSAMVLREPGEAATPTRYTVVHTKQDGRWQIASTRDYAHQGLGDEELGQLDWLVGEWVDESPDGVVITKYEWTENKRYLLSDFTVQFAGRGVMTGSSRIGWDPLAKVLRNWVFDSEGGFTEGSYARDGQRWIIKQVGVTRDGKAASSTNIITRLSKDRMTWQSRDRVIDGEVAPDIEPVLIVRKPPAPFSHAAAK